MIRRIVLRARALLTRAFPRPARPPRRSDIESALVRALGSM